MNTPQEFRALLDALRELEKTGFARGAAMVTLTRTQGSTFRRPGARMLVCGDGTVVRGLSGGCPEADMIARSHEVIASGQVRIVRYDRESGLDALIELGCGGQLEALIEPLSQEADLRFAYAIERCLSSRTPGFAATAFAVNGAALSPRPRRLVWSEEVLLDEFGDPELTRAVVERQKADAGKPRQTCVATIDSTLGAVDVLFESLIPSYAAILFGVSAVSFALARVGRALGWEITVVDHRDDRMGSMPSDIAASVVTAQPAEVLRRLKVDERTVAVVMTHNLERDIDYVRALSPAPFAYIGAIGSRQRARKLLDACGSASSRVRVPAGLDIGAETPEEIALAIAAEIIAVFNDRQGGALSGSSHPIH
jgi:xanthine/CO dehydrogenase XdhC/CoxF family maturation factor